MAQVKRYFAVIIGSFLATSCSVVTASPSFARGTASKAIPPSRSSKSGKASGNKTKAAGQNLIINGDFEYCPNWQGQGRMPVDKGSNTIYGWIVTSGNVAIADGPEWNLQFGRKCIDLNGSGPGVIAQKIVTEPGATYKVTFWLAGNPQGGPAIKSMFVRVGDKLDAWSADCTGRKHPGWRPVTWKFTADGASTTIEFGSTTSGSCGNMIDNVSVEKIPGAS